MNYQNHERGYPTQSQVHFLEWVFLNYGGTYHDGKQNVINDVINGGGFMIHKNRKGARQKFLNEVRDTHLSEYIETYGLE